MKPFRIPSSVLKRQFSEQQLSVLSRTSSFIPPDTSRSEADHISLSTKASCLLTTRRQVALVVQSEYFERLMLFLILINCILLAFESNHHSFEDSSLGRALRVTEFVFLSLFTIEMTLKILACGFVLTPHSYLRDGGWNVLDFVVIVLGWVAFAPSVGNYSALRAIRVLRSLRTITTIPGMRKLVSTLLQSLPMLLDVGFIGVVAYVVFGIMGVQLFSGALVQRCGCPSLNGTYVANGTGSNHCKGQYSDNIHWTLVQHQIYAENEDSNLVESYLCGEHPTVECPEGLLCAKTGNPNYGITNFDNIISAWLTIFQIISMEGWTSIMYSLQDAVSQLSWIYFCILIIIGSIFAVNLALAVLYLHFTNTGLTSDTEDDTSSCSMKSTIGSLTLTASSTNSDEHQNDIPIKQESWIRRQCTYLRRHQGLESFTMILIFFNVAVMAAERHGMPQWQQNLSEYTNTIVAIYFTVEMAIKMISLGWRDYLAQKSNVFDGVIAIGGLVELLISAVGNHSGLLGGSMYVLRVFRLLRIFKLSRSWHELNKIVSTVQGSIASMANLCLIFFLFIIMMALLGMQFFGFKLRFCQVPESHSYCPPGVEDSIQGTGHCDCYLPCQASEKGTWIEAYESVYHHQAYCEEFPRDASLHHEKEYWAQVGPAIIPRHNFDNFFWASLTVFQILTGENWNEVMYDLIRTTSYFAAFYCGTIILVGNYILLNLFLAILLDNFAGMDSQEQKKPLYIDIIQQQEEEEAMSSSMTSMSSNFARQRSLAESKIQCWATSFQSDKDMESSQDATLLQGHSLFLFSSQNPIRVFLHQIVFHWIFHHFIMLIILLSSIVLILESPEPKSGSFLAHFLYVEDRVINFLFGLEALMKIIAMGFLFNGPKSYLRDYWNLLDFFILLIGLLFNSELLVSHSWKSLRALRAVRALRPLRLARRNKGLRVVINSLFQSIPPLLNVALVCLLFFLTFGILGVSLMQGEFYYCADENGVILDPDIFGLEIDKAWCLEGRHVIRSSPYHDSINITLPAYTLNHSWKHCNLHFDDIGTAMLALFEMSTLEMWLEVMYRGMDAVGVDHQPRRDHNKFMAIFFLVFIITGAFFVLNLFVTVTIDKFHEIKERQEGRSFLLTVEQEDWVIMQRFMWVARPIKHYCPPKTSQRRKLFDAVNSSFFELLVMFVIFVNILALAIIHRDMDAGLAHIINLINSACTLFYLVEVLFKFLALGIGNYFRDRWNVFDFLVTLISLFGSPLWSAPHISLISAFRVVRLLRVIPKATGLRTLFQTLAFSFPALFNVGGVLSLFFFMYAVMGVQLFSGVRRGDAFTRHANFDQFPRALLTLFRMATGESWNGIMHNLMMMNQKCILLTQDYVLNSDHTIPAGHYFSPNDPLLDQMSDQDEVLEDQCNPNHPFVTVMYFCSFVLICGFILLNLVIAVILDNFQSSFRYGHLPIQQHQIEEFVKVWSELDPDATWYIPTGKLPILIWELSSPLGTKGTDLGMAEILSIILSLEIPNRNNKVHFLETLHSLMGQVAGTQLPLEEDLRIHRHMFHRLPSTSSNPAHTEYTAAHFHSGMYVQASIQGFMIREKITQMIKKRDFEGLRNLRQKKEN